MAGTLLAALLPIVWTVVLLIVIGIVIRKARELNADVQNLKKRIQILEEEKK